MGSVTKLNLIVLKTSSPDDLAKFYELLGINFLKHRHDTGPLHYASEMDDLVFEIYPLSKGKKNADNTLRLGFNVEHLIKTVEKIKSSGGKVIQEAVLTQWGYTAIIEDIDGRKIELKQVTS